MTSIVSAFKAFFGRNTDDALEAKFSCEWFMPPKVVESVHRQINRGREIEAYVASVRAGLISQQSGDRMNSVQAKLRKPNARFLRLKKTVPSDPVLMALLAIADLLESERRVRALLARIT